MASERFGVDNAGYRHWVGRILIGVSGWNYRHWRGRFYPDDLTHKRELAYAAEQFDSIEVNGTFYRLTSPSATRHWHDEAPDDFVYAVKGSRFITHNKKLKDPEGPTANFFASGVLGLGEKLGPILWQMSGNYRFDPERVERFFDLLPTDLDEAASLAEQHDGRVKDAAFGPGGSHRLRHVFEIRHESFFTGELVELARSHGVALAFSHSSEWRYTEELTTDFVYVRAHGPARLYDSPYGSDGLRCWSHRIRAWAEGKEPDDAHRISDQDAPSASSREVFVYFDNDGHAYAPREAAELSELTATARA